MTAQVDAMSDVAIEANDVWKEFGHIQALQGASIKVHKGEIVALVGDNGAGKSTLMKIMSGAEEADGGELGVHGSPVRLLSVRDAHALGIETVYQDLALAPHLTVSQNVFLGHEIVASGARGRFGLLAKRRMAQEATEALGLLGIQLGDASVRVSDLSGGQRQAVAIARAMKWAKSVLLMDEPTAALGARQTEIVLNTILRAAERGLGVLVVSHDMPHMLRIAHRIVVLRHGRVVASFRGGETDIPTVVAAMLGSKGVAAGGD
jgi:simple sugar transport system ATP-binding protein